MATLHSLKRITLERYVRIWGMFDSGEVPEAALQPLLQRPMAHLNAVATAFASGFPITPEKWEAVATAESGAEVLEIMREVKQSPPKGNTISLKLTRDGDIYVWYKGESLVDAATDRRLLDSPLGWGGDRLLATLWFAAGEPLARERVDALLDAARGVAGEHALAHRCGATSPDARLVVLGVLAPRAEPAWTLLTAVWRAWRQLAWGLAPCPPRVRRT